MKTILRWLSEVPAVVSVLPLFDGVYPLMSLRFGNAETADVRVRGEKKAVTIPDKISGMIFAHIWIRRMYPAPKPGDTVLDLGANIGMFSLYALSHGAKFCHCVEPCPDAVDRLKQHLQRWDYNTRTNVIAAGVAERPGTGFIPFKTSVVNKVSDKASSDTVEVPLVDILALVESLNPPPTYLKFDIEGNEIPVLRRLLSSRAMNSVHTIALEATTDQKELSELIEKAGFKVTFRDYPEMIIVGTREASK
jgi:FkbM family methyltransferase